MYRVKNDSVWHSLRILFTGALLIFLINIYFGFDNALTPAEEILPRWQALLHLHSGSVGWITLAAIGIAIWVLTGEREVSAAYEKSTRRLVWAAVLVFAAYVPFFGLAFSRANGMLVSLLPVLGSAAVIVLWWSAIYAFKQLGEQTAVSTVHVLAAGALLVAAVGATVGALLGMERVIGQFLPIENPDRVGVHAGMMDTYLFLIAAAIIEWFTTKNPTERIGKAGLVQAFAWTVGSVLVPIAFLTNTVEQIMPLFMLMLLVGIVIFFIRIGWKVIKLGPKAGVVQAWAFFGTIWLIAYMGLFLFAISVIGGGGTVADLPFWYRSVFAHVSYVGMMTGLILAVIIAFTWEKRGTVAWGDKVALWLIHAGLVLFAVLKITADIRLGAIVMGVGVLVGVYTMLMRLRASET